MNSGRDNHSFWEEYKGVEGMQYHLSYNIEAVGKNIKYGRGERNGNFGEENQALKRRGGEEYQVVGTLYTPFKMTD